MDPATLTALIQTSAQFGFAGVVAALLLYWVLRTLNDTLRQMVTLQRQTLVTLVRVCERLDMPVRDQPTGAAEAVARE